MIQLNRIEEDRTFSLNITLRINRNIHEDSNPPGKKLIEALDAHSIQSLIRRALKRNDIEVFTYYAKIMEIHESKKLERPRGAYQMMEYRITLEARTTINYVMGV